MHFCPKCGTILSIRKEKGSTIVECRCGYAEKKEVATEIRETLKRGEKIETVENEIEVHPLTHDAECPKCGHGAAYYWEIQTRASDEPATKFMKCEKCRHIWRDYK